MIRNLLPQDTRIAELASGWAMLFLSVGLMLGHPLTNAMRALHPPEFWVVVMFSLALLQMTALLLHPKAEMLRVIMALVNGAWWTWLSLTYIDFSRHPGDWPGFTLGLANIYGFMVGFLMLRSACRS